MARVTTRAMYNARTLKTVSQWSRNVRVTKAVSWACLWTLIM